MSYPKDPDDRAPGARPEGEQNFDDIDVREEKTPDKPGDGDGLDQFCTQKNETPLCGIPTKTTRDD